MLGVSSGLSKISAKPRRKYAAYFDGTGDYMDTGRTFQSTFQGSFSISLWVQPDDGQPATSDVLIGAANHASDAEDSVYIAISDSGDVAMNHRSNNVNGYLVTTNPIFPNGATDWTHIAATYTKVAGGNTTYKMYINGYEVTLTNSGSAISEANHAAFATTYNLYIGGNNAAGSLSTPYAGYIDEVAIFNKALTAAEVEGLYNSGKPFNLIIPSFIHGSAQIDSYGGYTEYTSGKLEAYWRMWGGKKAPTGKSFDGKRGVVLDQVASTGTELITNGSFGSNVSNWSVKANDVANGMSSGGTLSHDTDKLKFVGTDTDVGWQGVISDSFTLVPGKKYKMSAKFTTASGNASSCYLRLTTSTAWSGLHYTEVMNVGLAANTTWDNSVIFTNSTGTTMYVQAMCPSSSAHTFYLDDVSLVEVGDVFGDELYTGTSGDDANWNLAGDAAKTEDTATGSVKISVGTASANLKFRSSTGEFSTNLTVGETYLCSFLAKRTGTSGIVRFKATAANSAFPGSLTEEFKRYYLYFVCSDVDDNMIQTGAAAGTHLFIKDISLRKLNGNPALCEGGATDNRNHAATQTMSSVATFDGTGDYMQVGTNAPSTLINLNAISISCWIKTEGNNGNYDRIIDCSIAGGERAYRLMFNDTDPDKLSIGIWDVDDSSIKSLVSATATPAGQWYHAMVTFDGTTNSNSVKLYINNDIATNGAQGAADSDKNVNDNSSCVLRFGGSTNDANYFTGEIDEIAIWNVALDADAVAAVYGAGRGYDLTSDTGNYDNASSLQGYWRMGDGTFDDVEEGFIADQTNVGFGAEMVTNGTFDDATGWTISGEAGWAISGGTLTYTDNTGNTNIGYADHLAHTDFTEGAVYKVEFDAIDTHNVLLYIKGATIINQSCAAGHHVFYGRAGSSSVTGLRLAANVTSQTGSIDNLSVKKANGNPALTVANATTIKQPV